MILWLRKGIIFLPLILSVCIPLGVLSDEASDGKLTRWFKFLIDATDMGKKVDSSLFAQSIMERGIDRDAIGTLQPQMLYKLRGFRDLPSFKVKLLLLQMKRILDKEQTSRYNIERGLGDISIQMWKDMKVSKVDVALYLVREVGMRTHNDLLSLKPDDWDNFAPMTMPFRRIVIDSIEQKKQINECRSNSCENGGTCTDHFLDYKCTCPDGFTGRYCEHDMNSSWAIDRRNFEKAIDILWPNFQNDTKFSSSDLALYLESLNFETLDNLPLLEYADLSDLKDISAIHKRQLIYLLREKENINECEGNPCRNSEVCVDHFLHFRCSCSTSYGWCFTKRECKNKCKNGATCSVLKYQFKCFCQEGFTGERCELGSRPKLNEDAPAWRVPKWADYKAGNWSLQNDFVFEESEVRKNAAIISVFAILLVVAAFCGVYIFRKRLQPYVCGATENSQMENSFKHGYQVLHNQDI